MNYTSDWRELVLARNFRSIEEFVETVLGIDKEAFGKDNLEKLYRKASSQLKVNQADLEFSRLLASIARDNG